MIEPTVLVILAALIGILVFILLQTKKGLPLGVGGPRAKGKKTSPERTKPCPLCNTLLKKGETVKTVIYPAGSPGGDTLAEMFGCPHCYGSGATALRICPVCDEPVPDDGFVIGRMFKEGRHFHALGCTRCRKKPRGGR